MKKLLAILMWLMCWSATTSAHDFEVDGIYYNILSDTEKTVEVAYEGKGYPYTNHSYRGSLMIPESVSYNDTKYLVIGIGDNAFINNTSLTNIFIPNTVESIGNRAFEGCMNLKEIVIPNSVTNIGERAFYHCSNLTNIIIPNSVTNIERYTFYYCLNLSSITIPNSVTNIGYSAFENCSNLTSITIPNSVTNIGKSAFRDCSNLTSITIPNSVTNIGMSAFSGCSNLTSIIIPNSVRSIERFTFSGCSNLTSITIPNSVTNIGYSAFENCSNLTSITIPDSVTTIENSTFYGCTNLVSISIPSSVTSMGKNVFNGCPLLPVEDGIQYADTWAVNVTNREEGTYTLRPNTAGLAPYLFMDCKNMTSITIPDSVKSIGYRAFWNCKSLNALYINDLESWCKILIDMNEPYEEENPEGCSPLYYAHHLYLNGEEVKQLVIPNSVTDIGNFHFQNCWSLESVVIHDGVTSIGEKAFSNCRELTSVVIPSSLSSIAYYAFQNCTNLAHIELGHESPPFFNDYNDFYALESTCLIDYAQTLEVPLGSTHSYVSHEYWSKVESIYAMDGETKKYPIQIAVEEGLPFINISGEMNREVAENEEVHFSITDKDAVKYGLVMFRGNDISAELKKGEYVFQPTSRYQDNIVHTYAFPTFDIALKEAGDLVNQVPLDKIDSIFSLKVSGDFNGTDLLVVRKMKNLKLLDLTDAHIVAGGMNYYESFQTKDNTIGEYFFTDNAELLRVLFPKDVTSISDNACKGMLKLQTVVIPEKVQSIGASAFKDCTELTSCTLGQGLVTIGEAAFRGCSALKSVITFGGIQTIGKEAFLGCSSLESIVLPNSLTSIGASAFSGCSGLPSVDIPDNVISIGERAFAGCSGLTSVNLNDNNNLTCIEAYVFSGCSSLTSIIVPNSVTSIGINAFAGCKALTSIKMGNNIEVIASLAFYNCKSLVSIMLRSQIQIGEDAFSNCNNLTHIIMDGEGPIEKCAVWLKDIQSPALKVSLLEGVTSIGHYAFMGVTNLESVELPNSLTSIGHYAFAGCSILTSIEIPNSVTFIGNSAFERTGLTSIEIPNSVTSLGIYTFWRCNALTSVVIPSSLSLIDGCAFYECANLQDVYISDLKAWCNMTFAGNLANPLDYAEHLYLNGYEVKDLIVPNTVTSVKAYAFYSCENLTTVLIPSTVTTIGVSAFKNCNNLISVTMLNPTPPECEVDDEIWAFDEKATESVILYVPKGSKVSYWLHPYWGKFKTIVEIDVEGIENVPTSGPNNINTNLPVYTLGGQKVATNAKQLDMLSKGVYIIGNQKVLVK